MSFRHLKNVRFAKLVDILHSCLKDISFSATKDILEKASCKTDFEIFFKSVLKASWQDIFLKAQKCVICKSRRDLVILSSRHFVKLI